MPGLHYSKFIPPSLAMSELECQKLDNDATDMLIDKWLERPHRPDSYYDWFQRVRERKHAANELARRDQILLWNKGVFVPENIFTRTVDTGRLIPLDRTWVTHVYHHRSMKRLTMMPVIFSMLPELMLLRGMHDRGCDEIYVIVTDLKRHEMDQVSEYFQYVCQNTSSGYCKSSAEQKINHDYIQLSSTLDRNRRTPCFPQIDLTLRAILHEKRPPFIVLFSHQTMSYSQILFANPHFVPSHDVYHDFPSGCPNPGCTDNCCELIRFPKHGPSTAAVLCTSTKKTKTKKMRYRYGRRARRKEMCNWIDCDVCFSDDPPPAGEGSSEGSSEGSEAGAEYGGGAGARTSYAGLVCSRCKLVKYCSADHQRLDWDEHRRVCAKPSEE
ncbi:uncharacterized protein TRAVEDRAFT_46731 [Trametes versicolor FP-101664 SS1]|uniref:uncharacterized protein n=1 Tax=Trametes versicolor (strain FP-101664) TaxID=717944 RepID=UPI00046228A5|nr:uncharacterized protein TRAVEDRAFT_46731 [Trametes versicolor FP-101664 SS1]EIW59423.1 hypothetical protein TRAVEDRAFT_46731 [Trametes versicolor FP-101664 SS1]